MAERIEEALRRASVLSSALGATVEGQNSVLQGVFQFPRASVAYICLRMLVRLSHTERG